MSGNNFRKYVGPLGWIVPLVVALMGVPFLLGGEQFRQNYGVLSLIFALHWIAIVWLIWFAFEKADTFSDLPPVIVFEQSIGALITESRSWMGIGVAVSVYQKTGKIERLLCHGLVDNIQQDRSTQVKLIPLSGEDGTSLYERVEVISRGDLLIKPGQLSGQY